jgi:hypothetical protein
MVAVREMRFARPATYCNLPRLRFRRTECRFPRQPFGEGSQARHVRVGVDAESCGARQPNESSRFAAAISVVLLNLICFPFD